VTGLFLQLNPNSNLLLDCGEGTTTQLLRFYGKQNLNSELVKTKAVFLSHLHLDHVNGLYGFILKRVEAFKRQNIAYEKLNVLFPKYLVEHNLIAIEQICQQNIFDYINLIPNEMFMFNFNNKKVK
jgi:ribonuclease BN (tRNA processing enzyme)